MKILLSLVLILALFLRIYHLNQNPAGFFCDEASIGYNAYSLLTTGKDEFGVRWPIFYRAFGEYKSPVMLYSTIPSVFLFGLNEFSVRIVSATYGFLSILAIYLLTKNFLSPAAGLLSALFLTVSPWHLHLSRIGFETMPFIFFSTMAVYFWLGYFSKKQGCSLYLAIIFFALALYSYFPARIFIPLFTICLVGLYHKILLENPRRLIVCIVLTIALTLPLFLHIVAGPGMTRWHQVTSQKPVLKTVEVYLAHFSPAFLFLKGDIDFPGQFITRHSVRGQGELYFFQLPLILIGLKRLFKQTNHFTAITLFLWLILYPLADSLTNAPGPQATRSIIGVIPLQIISTLGYLFLLDFFRKSKKIFFFLFCLFSILIFSNSVLSFLKAYKNYPFYSSDFWGWQYGPKEIIHYFLSVKDRYDDLYMSGEFNAGEIFFKFYDPRNFCQEKCKLGDLWRNPQIYNPKRRQIFSLSPEYLRNSGFSDSFALKKTVYYPNGEIAFLIGEIQSLTNKDQK